MRSRTIAIVGAVVLLVVRAAIAISKGGSGSEKAKLPIVAITQIATHPALDEVRRAIIAGLAKRGFVDKQNVEIVFRNANGDSSLSASIAQDFAQRKPSVIVPISTPSALSIAKETKRIPIVFSGVTDPVGVGLVRDLNKPGGNITGVSDRWPFERQVATFLRVFPHVKRIGVIYTQGDDVSKIGVDALRALSARLGFELELRPVSSAQDIYPTATNLFQRVDAIYTGIDHLVLENLDGLVKAASEANKPLFGGESGSVEKGAVLAVTINMTDFGDITADLVSRVLRGESPGNLPIRTVTDGQLFVNRAAAHHFGLDDAQLKALGARFYDPATK